MSSDLWEAIDRARRERASTKKQGLTAEQKVRGNAMQRPEHSPGQSLRGRPVAHAAFNTC